MIEEPPQLGVVIAEKSELGTFVVKGSEAVFVGYESTAEKTKKDALEISTVVTKVFNEVTRRSCADALKVVQDLRKSVEAAHKAVKAKPLEVCQTLDQMKRTYLLEIEAEETRLKKLGGAYELKLIQDKRAEEDKKRRDALAAEQARLKALQDARTATTEEKRNEALTQATLIEEAKVQVLAVEIKAPEKLDGVTANPRWTFEVLDVAALYKVHPEAVELTVKRAVVNSLIAGGKRECAGLRIFEEVNPNTR